MEKEEDEEENDKQPISKEFPTANSSPPPPQQKPLSPPNRPSEDSPPAGTSPGASPPEWGPSSDHTAHDFSPREKGTSVVAPPVTLSEQPPSPVVVAMKRSVWDEPMAVVAKVDPGEGVADGVAEEGVRGGRSDERGRRARPTLSILRRVRRESMVKKAALGFRICGFAFCLISFSVMAADRNTGWALDSFQRYKEFKYCVSVNVIGAAYSAMQAYDLAYQLAAGKVVWHHLRFYFDFFVDQILTYLLMSASSSAATRVDDWQSNWGKDKFPDMAKASVGISFMAFVAFAFSSLVSGYGLCTLNHL